MERQKRDLIGISGSHFEYIVPSSSHFTIFFDLLRSQGCRSELITEKLTWERIEEFTSIFIGVPRNNFIKDEIAAVKDWVELGGNLFLIATMGGDTPPTGYDNGETSLGELTFGINVSNNCLGIFEQGKNNTLSTSHLIEDLPPNTPFKTELDIDVTNLLNHKALISYELGCSLSIKKSQKTILGQLVDVKNDSLKITHSLQVPDCAIAVEGTARLTDFNDREIFGFGYEHSLIEHYTFLRIQRGRGTISIIGSAKMFSNECLNHNDNLEFLNYLFSLWLPNLVDNEIKRRIKKPQRHRLLHGYPMSPLMKDIQEENRQDLEHLHLNLLSDFNRKFIVGVLPHPFCNPSVKGCGFCTFPHEVYSNTKIDHIVKDVIKEINLFFDKNPFLNVDVGALYFGGGTANLTPTNLFRDLCRSLNQHIDLTQSEVTLEGVPIYFTTHKPTILQVLKEEMPVRQLRISMGVQTFNQTQIKRMGRTAFGDKNKIDEIVKTAHSLNYIVSCDLLFNLPGQSLEEMKSDIDEAINIGFDQICIYHLVMFEGLGTEWSMDEHLLIQLPDNSNACFNWLELREYLISKGYIQNSLTNFERADVRKGKCRFVYEDYGYRPEKYDLLGFGPSAISLISDKAFNSAIKLLNPEGSSEYTELINSNRSWNRSFIYKIRDMKILYLTRKVVLLGLNRKDYRVIFNQDPLDDFPFEFARLADMKLIEIDLEEITLTPKGMFFADTIAGIFAWRQTHLLRFRDAIKGIKVSTPRPAFLKHAYDDSAFSFM
jgi:oxygen-independent coproporphyrinogen-3 oxidase